MRHGVELEHIDYVQIHPTSLYSKKPGRSFLISESVRGEGAKLRGKDGQRFANEVLPRDLMTAEIRKQMKKDDLPFVWLDMTVLGEDVIKHHFPHIYERCLEDGIDATKDWVPVTPAQHYFMGGIHVDKYSQTTMDISMPSAKRAATASTAATAWPAILSWKAWSSASAQPSTSWKQKSSHSRYQCRRVCPSLCAVRSLHRQS